MMSTAKRKCVMTYNDISTPLKFNMEPENGPLEKEIPLGKYHFQVLCQTLEVYTDHICKYL